MTSIFIANRNDYIVAQSIIGHQVLNTEFITQSAETYNLLETQGLPKITFVDSIALGRNSLSNCHYEADRIARTFDANLSELRTRHFNFEISSPGWDYLNIYYIALTVLRWRQFAPLLAAALPERDTLAFFTLDNEQDFYFDSALQRQFLADALQQGKFKNAKPFLRDVGQPFVQNAMNFTFDLSADASGSCEAVAHLPTVYYDYEYHRQRLEALHGAQVVDLASPYFDIPVAHNRIGLLFSDKAPVPSSLAERKYLDEVRRVTDDLYQILCPGAEIIPAQVERQAAKSLSQLRIFNQLCTAPGFANIRYLYVSDHDTGLSGPLTTWANLLDIATEIHPHSSFSVTPFPVVKGCRKHGYVRAPDSFTELGNSRSTWAHPLVIGSPTTSAPLVLLLFNALTDPGGVPTCEFSTIAKFTFDALMLCQSRQVPFKIRSKTSWDFSGMLAKYLSLYGVDANIIESIFAIGPLSDWTEQTTVCVGIDQPTTALTQFLNQGVTCIHAIDRECTETEMHTLPLRGVYLTDYNGALEKLKVLL
ncbi:hypothetical protein [Candidatus Methylobacter oryzae]|uniref:Uncharacterized protein n=1 Tax=Candidatus Methylobacter oryzae TaxID=2497749 RepID=A0ABY3CCC4_9GAMM|nr:hypothetical protein [Candidatus Methylobacter oryzae]TRW97082.1 hypothetical protein EKO24_008015 [Candidatus Methylobacter oryzae]